MNELPPAHPIVGNYPPPPPNPRRLTVEDLRSLVAGLEPGRYSTRVLWPRYQAWAVMKGRPEVHPRAFGKYMRAFVGGENVEVVSGGNTRRIFHLLAEHVSEPQSGSSKVK